MASQHNSTTYIDKGSEEPSQHYYKQGSHDPTVRAIKQQAEALHVWVQTSTNEKGWKPDYLQHPIKIVAEVLATSRSP